MGDVEKRIQGLNAQWDEELERVCAEIGEGEAREVFGRWKERGARAIKEIKAVRVRRGDEEALEEEMARIRAERREMDRRVRQIKVKVTSNRGLLEGRIEQGRKEIEELVKVINEVETANTRIKDKIESER